MGILEILLIAIPCGSAALAFVYGFFRKFSRVTWIGWQVLLLFALTFLLGTFKAEEGSVLAFVLTAVGAFAVVLLLFGAEWLLRNAILKRNFGKGVRILGRFGGALSAIAATLMFELVLFGLVFSVIGVLPSPPAFFMPVLGSAFWTKFFAGHAYDLFVIAVFFVFARAGMRLGLVRAVYYLLMFALTFACFWGAVLLATKVGFLSGWGNSLAAKFPLAPAAASLIGHGIIGIVCFIVLFAAAMLFGALLHWLLRKFISFRAIGLVDGLILCIVFVAVFIAFTCALYYGVAYLAAQTGGEGILPRLAGYAQRAAAVLRSAPFTRIFYDCNPFLSLIGL